MPERVEIANHPNSAWNGLKGDLVDVWVEGVTIMALVRLDGLDASVTWPASELTPIYH